MSDMKDEYFHPPRQIGGPAETDGESGLYSRNQIRSATKMAQKDKERRNSSSLFKQKKLEPIICRVETAKCGLKRITSSSSFFSGGRKRS